jgi:hypothetical protein
MGGQRRGTQREHLQTPAPPTKYAGFEKQIFRDAKKQMLPQNARLAAG